MTRRGLPFITLTALVTLAPSVVAPRALACVNAVLATEKTVAAVKEAEQILDDGNPAEAQRRIAVLLRGAEGFEEEIPSAKGLTSRARRILALADVRLDPNGTSGELRRAVLANAVATLERLAKEKPDDAKKQTDLAEALAKTKPAEAKKKLEDLAGRDVMTTPYGYAALARLRAADGDDKGRDAALSSCKRMAKVESICQLEPPKGKKA